MKTKIQITWANKIRKTTQNSCLLPHLNCTDLEKKAGKRKVTEKIIENRTLSK